MPKVRDMDKTITGFIFNPYFIIGLLQFLVGAGCVVCCYFLFNSDEPLFLRIVGCLVMLLAAGSGLSSGWKKIKGAWKDWRNYLKEE